jgi:hypothetical protein
LVPGFARAVPNGDDQVGAGRQHPSESAYDAARGLGVHKMEDAAEDHAGGLAQVEAGPADLVVAEDRLWTAHVPGDRHHAAGALSQKDLRMQVRRDVAHVASELADWRAGM